MLNSFKDFYLCIKETIMWYPDNQSEFFYAAERK